MLTSLSERLIERWGVLLITLLGVGVLFDGLVSMIVLWLTTDTYMHGTLVLPMVAFLAHQQQRPSEAGIPLPIMWAVALAALWGVSVMFGILSMTKLIQQLAILSLIPLVVLIRNGVRYTWHYRTPLVLIFLAVPVGDFLIPYLQSFTADMSVAMLRMVGVSVLHNGWYISISNADFRVAEACSGINFLISTFTVGVFYSFAYFQKPGKRLFFILMSILVPLLANGVRVFLIIMVAHWGNVEAATGFDHLVYGWIFFSVVLIVLFALGMLISDPPAPLAKPVSYTKKSERVTKGEFVLILVLLALLVGNVTYQRSLSSAEASVVNVTQNTLVTTLEDVLRPSYPHADEVKLDVLSDGVLRYSAIYFVERDDKKMVSYENRLFDENIWSIKSSARVELSDGQLADFYVLVDLNGVQYHLYHRYSIDNAWLVGSIQVKWHQFFARVTGSDFGGRVVLWLAPASTKSAELVSKTL
jgi:exosortase A